MTRRCGPEVGTVAWRILAALDAAPLGSMSVAQLLPLLDENNRTKYKLWLRADVLFVWDLARRLPDGLQIQPPGRAYLRAHAVKAARCVAPETPLTTAVPTSMATPRSAPPFKPLDMAKLMRNRPRRDGMNDLRNAPSLIGSTRVARVSNLLIESVP